jgi:hypothetical protein
LPLSVFALNLVIALGLGLSVDFSLLIVSRFREEFARQGSIDAALATVRQTAGHTVLFSSLTIAAAMATLAIFPERFVYSMGIAGRDRRLGRRRLRPVRPAFAPDRLRGATSRRTPRHVAPPSALQETGEPNGTLVPDRHARHAATLFIWALSAILVLVVLAAPFLHVSFTGADASSAAGQQLGRDGLQAGPDQVRRLLRSPGQPRRRRAQATPGELASSPHQAAAVPGVKAVSTFEHLGGSLWESNVALSSAPLSPQAQQTVNDLQVAARSGTLTVVGQTASFLSAADRASSRTSRSCSA